MTTSAFDEAFEKVKSLAATFKASEARYLSADYQEAEARKDFIDKFFIALGWDVNHDIQTNPYAQEVKVERAHGGSQRRADYAFYLAPNFRDVRYIMSRPRNRTATSRHPTTTSKPSGMDRVVARRWRLSPTSSSSTFSIAGSRPTSKAC
jgi:hypothetical protein